VYYGGELLQRCKFKKKEPETTIGNSEEDEVLEEDIA
jgi:hypothetical protein